MRQSFRFTSDARCWLNRLAILAAWLALAACVQAGPPDSPLLGLGNVVDRSDLTAYHALGDENRADTAALPPPGTTTFRAMEPVAPADANDWSWQALPEGLIYRSYLAGAKEPRFASQWMYDKTLHGIWDITLGGRVALARYGTRDPLHPDGFEIDMEGAAMPRLNLEHMEDLVAADFRFGVPLAFGYGRYQTKFGFYHLSSHMGDEYMLLNPTLQRINYSRNCLVWGHSYYATPDVRLYGETAYATDCDGGSKPWEFQFGIDYSPAAPNVKPVPFVAINGALREDVDYGGNLVFQTGLQWRGTTGHLFRMGMNYFTGKSDQFEFYNRNENKIGLALWYDY